MLTGLVRLFTLSLLVAAGGAAHAQDYDAAGRAYAAGQERYAQKHFHTAALEFQAAYDITKDPALLFNVGESWQRAADGPRAVAAYRSYLKEKPDAADRTDIEGRIKALEKPKKKLADESATGDKEEADQWLAQGGAPPIPAPTPPPAPEVVPPQPEVAPEPVKVEPQPEPVKVEPQPEPKIEPKPPEPAQPSVQIGLLDDRPATKLRIAAWASVAATIALLTTGAILGLAAQSRADEISRRLNFVDTSLQPAQFDAGARSDFSNLKDEGHLYNGLAIGFYSAAGAMAITTTVLFIVDWRHRKSEKEKARASSLRFSPTLAPGTVGLTLQGAF